MLSLNSRLVPDDPLARPPAGEFADAVHLVEGGACRISKHARLKWKMLAKTTRAEHACLQARRARFVTDSVQSKGGRARAERLSPEDRRRIAQAAAEARWAALSESEDQPAPRATHIGEIKIGELLLPCAVLEDGTRLLSERGVSGALGKTRSGSHWQKKREHGGEFELPLYLTSDNLRPFISSELGEALSSRILYRPPQGGRLSFGVRATALPQICEVWLRARDAGVLHKRQFGIAAKADMLIRGLAQVGIIALVDEATGYQEARGRSALEAILNRYLQDELRKWTKTFPDEYFLQIFRLRGWRYPDVPTARPGAIAAYTNDLVYARLAPGVLEELQRRNPTDGHGRRRHKLFQHLSNEHGDPRLREHLNAVIVLMKASANWEQFKRLIDRGMPRFNDTLELALTDEDGNPR